MEAERAKGEFCPLGLFFVLMGQAHFKNGQQCKPRRRNLFLELRGQTQLERNAIEIFSLMLIVSSTKQWDPGGIFCVCTSRKIR